MPIGVIIVAAGRGSRLGGGVPKQFADLGGRSMLRRSVEAFDGRGDVACLVVVLPAELLEEGKASIGATALACRVVAGGSRRQDSVRLGLAAMPDGVDLVLVHDAARPFVERAVIDRVIAAARRTGAAVPAVLARDTVKRVDAGQRLVTATIPRDEIWLAQTPQGFARAVLDAAVTRGASGEEATDEALLVERGGGAVEIVDGDPRNMKITTVDDLADARARWDAPVRVGTGYDLHRLADGRTLVLAGVVLSTERGPVGHSDGDVVCHAVIDAMLGAAAAGDIGRHFPDSDARWTNSPGLDLLARAKEIVAASGWWPSSVDVTVILERPKLAPVADDIRAGLAAVLGLDADRVSVKAKTNEGVDATGRGEAIAAHAVAVLVPGAAR